jgi:hypothetical protein
VTAWPAAPAPGATARDALRQVAGGSWRQSLAFAALAGSLLLAAWQLHASAWAATFVMLLAPLVVTGVATQLVLRLLPPASGWRIAWSVLLVLIALGAWLGWFAYQRVAPYTASSLTRAQVLTCAAAFGLLVLALPLWRLQGQLAAVRLASLEQAALSAELKALQAQIEPHFLYNTLANTRYLARHDPARAVQMLDHLIAYLHSALPDMRSSGSTLGREFELAGHYLALMVIRFGERLTYTLDCPDALAGASMPPLLLMSLVENAVRHGVEPTPGQVRVALQADVADGQLCVVVRDDGAGTSGAVLGSGVGLRNLRARLQAQYQGAARFTLHMEEGAPTEATLHLPLDTLKLGVA